MNFSKNKRNKESGGGGRFSDLKDESNPFKKKSNNNSRSNSSDHSKSGSYVPPSQRRKQKEGNRFSRRKDDDKNKNNFRRSSPKQEEKVKIAPNVNDEEAFPTLAPQNVIISNDSSWAKKLVVKEEPVKEEPVNKEEEEDIQHDDTSEEFIEETNQDKDNWATIIKRQDPAVKEDDPDFIKPGWVRLSYDKESKKYVQEWGAEVPESAFFRELRLAKIRKFYEDWNRRIKEYEEYDEFMGHTNNYYYSWQADEVDAERALEEKLAKMEEEWQQMQNASDDDYSDNEYYEDEYY